MYFLSILAVILSSILMITSTSFDFSVVFYYFDSVGLLLLLIITIPILISANLLKDFNNAFKLTVFKKKAEKLSEIKRAIEAVSLTMKILIYAGVFIVLFSMIMILGSFNLEDIKYLGPSLAVTSLSLLYAVAINLVLLPVKSKLKIILDKFIQE